MYNSFIVNCVGGYCAVVREAHDGLLTHEIIREFIYDSSVLGMLTSLVYNHNLTFGTNYKYEYTKSGLRVYSDLSNVFSIVNCIFSKSVKDVRLKFIKINTTSSNHVTVTFGTLDKGKLTNIIEGKFKSLRLNSKYLLRVNNISLLNKLHVSGNEVAYIVDTYATPQNYIYDYEDVLCS